MRVYLSCNITFQSDALVLYDPLHQLFLLLAYGYDACGCLQVDITLKVGENQIDFVLRLLAKGCDGFIAEQQRFSRRAFCQHHFMLIKQDMYVFNFAYRCVDINAG
jgi:hypothetical protein